MLFKAAVARADKLRAKGKVIDDEAFKELLRLEPDKGNDDRPQHAKPPLDALLEPASRCLVPFTSFCEPDQASGSLK